MIIIIRRCSIVLLRVVLLKWARARVIKILILFRDGPISLLTDNPVCYAHLNSITDMFETLNFYLKNM